MIITSFIFIFRLKYKALTTCAKNGATLAGDLRVKIF